MSLLQLEVWVGNEWQRVQRLNGRSTDFRPPARGGDDDHLSWRLDEFLKANAGQPVWIETDQVPHGVRFPTGAVGPFRMLPVSWPC